MALWGKMGHHAAAVHYGSIASCRSGREHGTAWGSDGMLGYGRGGAGSGYREVQGKVLTLTLTLTLISSGYREVQGKVIIRARIRGVVWFGMPLLRDAAHEKALAKQITQKGCIRCIMRITQKGCIRCIMRNAEAQLQVAPS